MDYNHSPFEDMRKNYTFSQLDEKHIFEDPIRQFKRWFDEALKAGQEEPNAMTLATASPDGLPDARIVLLKGVDEEGFRFYTNHQSTKGKMMAANNRVALVFFWKKTERQVRILGEAYRLSEEVSTEYYKSRPKGSQIGAWISPQSQVIESRAVIEDAYAKLEKQNQEKERLDKPPHWGGYVVKPYQIEFWQGRTSRLHDRLRYTLSDLEPKKWTLERLAP